MKKYQSYKPSDVEWIGEIPEHWKKSKLKYDVILTMGQSPESENYNDEQIGIPFLQGNTEFGLEFPINTKWTTQVTKTSKIGDILYSVRGSLGEINFSDKEYCIGRGLCSIRPKNLNTKLCFYILNFLKEEIKSLGVGSTFLSVTTDDLKNLNYHIPPQSEQLQIVKFLDEKTELIDKIILTKERKISLLKEQSTTLINQVVTKGLNPNVKMKDSGVLWIGEIPEHWKSCNLRYILDLLTDFESNGSFSSVKENVKVDDEGEVWYVRMTDLENNNIRNENCKYCDLDTYNFLHKTKVYGGELLITKRGEIGKVYLFPYNCGLSTLGPNSYLLRLKNIVNSHFLYFFYKSDIGQTTLKLLDNSTTIGSLYKDDIKGSSVIVPPIDEQHQIVEYLDSKTKEIDDLVHLEQKKINLLKEYRQSLISEVVTGKIKVTK